MVIKSHLKVATRALPINLIALIGSVWEMRYYLLLYPIQRNGLKVFDMFVRKNCFKQFFWSGVAGGAFPPKI